MKKRESCCPFASFRNEEWCAVMGIAKRMLRVGATGGEEDKRGGLNQPAILQRTGENKKHTRTTKENK